MEKIEGKGGLQVRCEEANAMLDQLLDGTLTDGQLRMLEAHGQTCAACGEQIRAALQMKALFSEMAPEADVPLAAQAAWRGAVKAEAGKKRLKRYYSWIGVAAAAVVLVVGVSLGLNGRIAPRAGSDAASMMAVEEASGVSEAAGVVSEDIEGTGMALFEEAGTARLEADGASALIGAAAPEGSSKGAATAEFSDYAADMVPEAQAGNAASGTPMHELCMRVESVDAACGTIEDLVSEYEGSVDTQSQDGAANLYIVLPAENVSEFISAIAHLDVDGEMPDVPDLSGETSSALLLALTE